MKGRADLPASSTKRIGEANKQLVLNEVRMRERASVDELVRHTRRSHPTVMKWLGVLERDGYLMRWGFGESRGGRPPTLYRFNARREYLLGLAVEIPAVQAALIDLNGQMVVGDAWKLGSHLPAEAIQDQLADRVETFLSSAGVPREKLAGCGVVLSGFVDQKSGLSLASPRLVDWRDVPVRDFLAARLNTQVILNHHIDALTLAELSCGVAKGWRDFVYFDVGHGLGVRLVHGGQPVQGVFGNAGLIGHTTVVPDGRRCICGNTGCLEEYVSVRAWLRQLADDPGSAKSLQEAGDADGLAARTFQLGANAGVRLQRRKAQTLKFLAIGVANAVNVFDMPRVVVSGFVTHGGAEFREELTAVVKARLQPPLSSALEIVYASVPRTQAGARGAALFALKHRLPAAEPLLIQAQAPKEGGEPPPADAFAEPAAVTRNGEVEPTAS